jgi:predicted ATP-dependent endonuclease of OLD family
LTIVVGENDAGKTSLIECLKVITQGRSVNPDDFTYGREQLLITIEIEDFVFRKEYRRSGNTVTEEPLIAFPTTAYVQKTLDRLRSENLDISSDEEKNFIREVAKLFGLTVRSNSVIENLRVQLIDRLSADGDLIIDGATFPRFNHIQLDGRHFENIPAFFKEVFLKEKQASIWRENVNEGITIETFVRSHLEAYSNEVSRQIQDRGITDKLRLFLPELTEVKVEPVFHARDLNVDAKVKFLENGTEISIENKGDGTKRRMTMALLEFKKDQSLASSDSQTVYLLDEPDTHLHVRAQLDLVKTVEGFSFAGNQVILTTHSPFIVNAAKPSQVRLLVRSNGTTSVRSLVADPSHSSKILRALGVENTHLFFSRKIVIVEGETEEAFLPAQYLKLTNRTLSSGLTKVINVHGVQNIVGFSRAILELHDPERIYILCDNDASPELQELINQLGVTQEHKFQVGTREFEDAFHSSVIQRAWAQYHLDCGKEPPADWTEEAIEQLKSRCIADDKKFSKELRALGRGGKSMKKPVFGAALGERVEFGELPHQLRNLLDLLAIP